MTVGSLSFKLYEQRQGTIQKAQSAQARMKSDERADLARRAMMIKDWLLKRQQDVMEKPVSGVIFDDEIDQWIQQPAVRNFESDLFEG